MERATRRHWSRGRILLVGVAAIAATVVPPAATADAAGGTTMRIEVRSGRADLVTGGDALVAITGATEQVRVDVDGRDVTGRFAPGPDGSLVGLVDGLRDGPNRLTARSSADGATITLTNHPIGGPVLAGPQVRPWVCGTEQAGLGPPVDEQCTAPSVRSYTYKNALTGSFVDYDPNDPPLPAFVATTVTDQGKTVRYVVRVETGVIDRGIYRLAVLHTPEAWNHKLVTRFGGGATGHYTQDPPAEVLDDNALSRGFMVASSGLMVYGSNTNQVVAAETLMMLKEHIIEDFGQIRYTIGIGCSGGSLQQHLLAAGYPGLLDGIQPACSYPDLWTSANQMTDCHLLERAYAQVPALGALLPHQRVAINGHQTTTSCEAWRLIVSPTLDPTNASACNLPQRLVYDPATNPTGVRCSAQDYQKAIWGPREQDGFAHRPLDNTGIQYGLDAFDAGTITADQFVTLNERIGGLDIDWRHQPARMRADPRTLRTAYRSGQVTDARHLAAVPIIDLRPYSELEYHNSVHSYQLRAKLDRDNGGHRNQVIWTFPRSLTAPELTPSDIAEKSLVLLDTWLANIEKDTSATPPETKTARAKPAELVDSCWILDQQVTDPARCAAVYPHHATPRIAAGAPLTEDAIACQLTPLNRDDYDAVLTDEQWQRLRAAFLHGVCDPTKPGIEQHRANQWVSFAAGPGGLPLGPPPESSPIQNVGH